MRMEAYRRSAAFDAMFAAGAHAEGGRYGAGGRGLSWPVLSAIVALHLIGLWAMMTLGVIRVARVKAPPTVVSLLPDAVPPPPAAAEPAPEVPAPVELVAPPLLVSVPVAAPVELRTVEVPPPVVAASAPAAPAARPGPVADAVVPPDFQGDQLGNPAPRYPSLSRRLREQGTVVVRVMVTPGGTARDCRVQRSSGFERLDKAALGTVCDWRFQPATRGGVAVDWPMDVPIPFVLRG